jgi:hypothetical protein
MTSLINTIRDLTGLLIVFWNLDYARINRFEVILRK